MSGPRTRVYLPWAVSAPLKVRVSCVLPGAQLEPLISGLISAPSGSVKLITSPATLKLVGSIASLNVKVLLVGAVVTRPAIDCAMMPGLLAAAGMVNDVVTVPELGLEVLAPDPSPRRANAVQIARWYAPPVRF